MASHQPAGRKATSATSQSGLHSNGSSKALKNSTKPSPSHKGSLITPNSLEHLTILFEGQSYNPSASEELLSSLDADSEAHSSSSSRSSLLTPKDRSHPVSASIKKSPMISHSLSMKNHPDPKNSTSSKKALITPNSLGHLAALANKPHVSSQKVLKNHPSESQKDNFPEPQDVTTPKNFERFATMAEEPELRFSFLEEIQEHPKLRQYQALKSLLITPQNLAHFSTMNAKSESEEKNSDASSVGQHKGIITPQCLEKIGNGEERKKEIQMKQKIEVITPQCLEKIAGKSENSQNLVNRQQKQGIITPQCLGKLNSKAQTVFQPAKTKSSPITAQCLEKLGKQPANPKNKASLISQQDLEKFAIGKDRPKHPAPDPAKKQVIITPECLDKLKIPKEHTSSANFQCINNPTSKLSQTVHGNGVTSKIPIITPQSLEKLSQKTKPGPAVKPTAHIITSSCLSFLEDKPRRIEKTKTQIVTPKSLEHLSSSAYAHRPAPIETRKVNLIEPKHLERLNRPSQVSRSGPLSKPKAAIITPKCLDNLSFLKKNPELEENESEDLEDYFHLDKAIASSKSSVLTSKVSGNKSKSPEKKKKKLIHDRSEDSSHESTSRSPIISPGKKPAEDEWFSRRHTQLPNCYEGEIEAKTPKELTFNVKKIIEELKEEAEHYLNSSKKSKQAHSKKTHESGENPDTLETDFKESVLIKTPGSVENLEERASLPQMSIGDMGELKDKVMFLLEKMQRSEQEAKFHELENGKLKEIIQGLEEKIDTIKIFHDPVNVSCSNKCEVF